MKKQTITTIGKVVVYANGLVYCSVCADGKLTEQELLMEVNFINPSGVKPWKISKEKFKDGIENPTVCNSDKNRKHYLMNC